MRKIGIVFAIEREARSTLDEAAFGWKAAGPGLYASERWPLALAVSGIGKAFAACAAARVGAEASLLLSLGTSGSLAGPGSVGGLLLAGEFVEYDIEAGALHYPPGVTPCIGMTDPLIASATESSLGPARAALSSLGLAFAEGRVASGDSFVDDPTRARFVRERTGADAVDMESAAIAKVAVYAGLGPGGASLECLALRTYSDSADRRAPRSWCEDGEALCAFFPGFLKAFAPLYCGADPS